MLFAIPVSQSDLPLLRPFVDVLKFLGGLHRHTLIFLPAPTVAGETAAIVTELNGLCGKLAVDAVAREPEGGWPDAPNMHFRDAVEQLDKRGELGQPFMWLEADCTPLRAGWADRLELEYNRQGKWALGVVRPVSDVLRDKDGKPTGEGDYMVGAGIYGANFKKWSCLYRYPVPKMPFDINIRFEVKKAGVYNTNLIESRGRTGNYRINADGKIECDEASPLPTYPSLAGVVGDMAFVVHGCKDGSLAKLVLSGSRATQMPVEALSENIHEQSIPGPDVRWAGIEHGGTAPIGAEPRTGSQNSYVDNLLKKEREESDRLRGENAELKAMLAKLEQAQTIPASFVAVTQPTSQQASTLIELMRSEISELKLSLNGGSSPERLAEAALFVQKAELDAYRPISASPGASEGSLCLTSSEAEGGADSPTVPSDAEPDPDPSVNGMPPIEQIRKVVGTGKKRRLADLAADLGVNQMRLRNLLKTPGTGLRIMQGGYVAIA